MVEEYRGANEQLESQPSRSIYVLLRPQVEIRRKCADEPRGAAILDLELGEKCSFLYFVSTFAQSREHLIIIACKG